jgi:hypothetical protein
MFGEMINIKELTQYSEVRRLIFKHKCKWEESVTMALGGIVFEGVDSIQLTQNNNLRLVS